MNTRQIFDLTGSVAIVTGGSVGLGRQMAEGLAEMGAHLVLCARKKERCQRASEELAKTQACKFCALGCDVKEPASIRETLISRSNNLGASMSWSTMPVLHGEPQWRK